MSKQSTLREKIERFPYRVAERDRGAYFDDLVDCWPAPELLAAIAEWRSDCLLPFLEAAQSSATLSNDTPAQISTLSWLDPVTSWDDDERDVTLDEFSQLGLETRIVDELPASLDESHFERLAHALIGQDALISPLTALRSQALDLLCARVLGKRVALIVPDPLSRAMGGVATMPQLMTVAQTACVIVVPLTTNLTFWTMAAHACLVDAEKAGHGIARQQKVLDALNNPLRPKRRENPSPSAAKEPLAPLAGATLGVAAGIKRLKFPPIISSDETAHPENKVPLDERALKERIARLERQLADAKRALDELENPKA